MNWLFTLKLRAAVILGMIGLAPVLAIADEFRLESASLPAPMVDDAGKVNTVIEASAVERIERARSLGHEPSQLWMTLASVAGELRRRRA